MVDPSPPGDLLGRAGRVFDRAARLARALHDEAERASFPGPLLGPAPGPVAAAGWERHRPAFDELYAAVLDLSGPMQNPPDGFAPVARALADAGRVVRDVRDTMGQPAAVAGARHLLFRYGLGEAAAAGREAVRAATAARRPADPLAFLDRPAAGGGAGVDTTPPPPKPPAGLIGAAASGMTEHARPPTGAQRGEGGGPKPEDKPDGPFGVDGFRFAGVEVKFGRAGKQYRLVMALWDAAEKSPAPPRPVEDVIAEVWGDDNETEDSAFRQLCADTRARFQKALCPLEIRQVSGKVQLSPV